MRIDFVRPFLSFVDLPAQEIPDFTVLTGVNGAGKSHFLKAVLNGAASADIAPNPNQDIRLFDWSNLIPRDEGDFSGDILRQEQTNLYNHYKSFLNQPWGLESLHSIVRASGATDSILNDPSKLLSADSNEICSALNIGLEYAAKIRKEIENASAVFAHNLNAHLPQHTDQIKYVVDKSGKHIFCLTLGDFQKSFKPNWGQAELFQNSLARIFVFYRDLKLLNGVAQYARSNGHSEAPALDDEEFLARYGQPPWDFVNTSLKVAGLDFLIDAPYEYSLTPYRPILRKLGSRVEINFDSLSSGERILMSFAFALYYAHDSRQQINKPKLILLDEVDAPLHPSMCRSLIKTINDVIVAEYGVKVILTTHSPTTVALSPEEAIYVMEPGKPGLHKTTKDAALHLLTDGVPTLSLSYHGRRQIFVESPRDVEIYQSSFSALQKYINSEITLNFIATGVETVAGNHSNTGCTIVRRIVSDLRNAGAQHTFGLVDWDGINKSGGNIFVLAENDRDGLESVIFDPLLILNVLMRQNGSGALAFGLPAGTSYISMASLSLDELQIGIDNVQTRVLGRVREKSILTEYASNIKLQIDQEYLTMDDHDLEQKIDTAFPELRSISKKRVGELAKWITKNVFLDRPEHIPKCLVDTLKKLVLATS